MPRKGRTRKVTRRKKLKGGFDEDEYEKLLIEKEAIPLIQLKVNKRYTANKVDDLENSFDVEIIRNGRGDDARDVTVFEDEDGNQTTIKHTDTTNYMSKDGYFFTALTSDPGPTEDEEDPTGGRRKRKLKRSTRRKHL